MAATVQCPACARQYRVSDKYLGRRGKCKHCGEPFLLVAESQDVGDELLSSLSAGTTRESDEPPPIPAPEHFSGFAPSQTGSLEPTVDGQSAGGTVAYLRDVVKSLLFFRSLGDSVTFGIVVLMMCLPLLLSFGGIFGVLGNIIIIGWYMAFQLNVVLGAASGEDNLPDLNVGDWVEGILWPLIKYLITWFVAMIPYALGLVYLTVFNQMNTYEAAGHFLAAITGDFAAAFDVTQGGGQLQGGILLLSVILWPMILLVTAVGGPAALVRFDLIVITILKCPHVYLLVVILAYVGVVGPALLSTFVLEGGGGGALSSFATVAGMTAALTLLEVYANVFTMRVIGLYYHHFKHRFAWSWG